MLVILALTLSSCRFLSLVQEQLDERLTPEDAAAPGWCPSTWGPCESWPDSDDLVDVYGVGLAPVDQIWLYMVPDASRVGGNKLGTCRAVGPRCPRRDIVDQRKPRFLRGNPEANHGKGALRHPLQHGGVRYTSLYRREWDGWIEWHENAFEADYYHISQMDSRTTSLRGVAPPDDSRIEWVELEYQVFGTHLTSSPKIHLRMRVEDLPLEICVSHVFASLR